ncbi:MAG: hypothetical protein BroJett015_32470 [Chloroflexota bacterium]|nr:MAG: hypothetical protein BroJett015_32470 [Chloroflexota bacterium]
MIRKIWDRYSQNRKLGVILITALVLSLVTTIYAWDTAARHVHDYQTGWSADDGYHRGKNEWSGSDRRIRVVMIMLNGTHTVLEALGI